MRTEDTKFFLQPLLSYYLDPFRFTVIISWPSPLCVPFSREPPFPDPTSFTAKTCPAKGVAVRRVNTCSDMWRAVFSANCPPKYYKCWLHKFHGIPASGKDFRCPQGATVLTDFRWLENPQTIPSSGGQSYHMYIWSTILHYRHSSCRQTFSNNMDGCQVLPGPN